MSRSKPPGWNRLRLRVLTRDQARCRHCSARDPNVELHAHHIVPVERGGKDEITNLVTLCESCHYETHGHISSHKYIGQTDLPKGVSELREIITNKERIITEKKHEAAQLREKNRALTHRVEELEEAISPDDEPPLILHKNEESSVQNRDSRLRRFDAACFLKRLKWRVFGMPEDADE